MSLFDDYDIGKLVRETFIDDRVIDSQVENQEQLNLRWARLRAQGVISDGDWAKYQSKYDAGVSGQRLIQRTDTEIGAAVVADVKESVSLIGTKLDALVKNVLGAAWADIPISVKFVILAVIGLLLYRWLSPMVKGTQ